MMILYMLFLFSDCTTLNNHCVCAENFEYFRKPDHLLQCIRKRKCFHCQRYRAMDRKYESVAASTNLLLIAAALGKFDIFRFLHSVGGCLETKSGIFQLRSLHLAIVNGHFNIFCYLLAQQVRKHLMGMHTPSKCDFSCSFSIEVKTLRNIIKF